MNPADMEPCEFKNHTFIVPSIDVSFLVSSWLDFLLKAFERLFYQNF